MNSEGQPTNNPAASAATLRASVREIMPTLKDAADPLAFIQANLQAQQPPPADPNTVIKQVEDKRVEEAKADAAKQPEIPVPDINLTEKEKEDGLRKETPDEGSKDVSQEAGEIKEDGSDEEEEVKNTSAENFKNLRNIVKETKKILAEREAKLKETEAKLTAYETGEVLPEALQAKEQRISELERYEQILSLKTSPQYQEKYVRPLTQIKGRLEEIAKDYAIPKEVMHQALAIGNRAELNRFLSSHFDDVGALEVKGLVEQARTLQQEAQEAEKEPTNALERIMAEAENARAARRKQELSVMQQNSKDAWVDSLLEIRKEGDAVELIHREGDTEYNQKFVDPIIKAAAQEYGKLVSMLAKNGLENLPKDLAFALSRMCQLAHASGVALHTRNEAVRRAEELETNVKRTTSYVRPQIGASNGHGNAPAPKQPASPKEAAEVLLQKVMPR